MCYSQRGYLSGFPAHKRLEILQLAVFLAKMAAHAQVHGGGNRSITYHRHKTKRRPPGEQPVCCVPSVPLQRANGALLLLQSLQLRLLLVAQRTDGGQVLLNLCPRFVLSAPISPTRVSTVKQEKK